MEVKELNRNQLVQLKQMYLTENKEEISWGELADADDIVTDEEVFNYYSGTNFVEEDFSE